MLLEQKADGQRTEKRQRRKVRLPAARRWTALRRLNEDYGVPLAALEPLAACKPETLRKRLNSEDWQTGVLARAMAVRINAVIDRQMDLLQTTVGEAFDEGQVKALTAMAKALEIVAGIERRFAEGECTTADKDSRKQRRGGGGNEEPGGAAALEAELLAFVEANS